MKKNKSLFKNTTMSSKTKTRTKTPVKRSSSRKEIIKYEDPIKTTKTKAIESKTKKTKGQSCMIYTARRPELLSEDLEELMTGKMKKETLKDIQKIESVQDVDELKNIYDDLVKRFNIRSLQIERIFSKPVPIDEIPKLKSYMKDLAYFAPCFERLNDIQEKFLKKLIERLKEFKNTIDETRAVDKDVTQELISLITFSKSILDKEDSMILSRMKKLNNMKIQSITFNHPSITWLSLKEDFSKLLDNTDSLINRGIFCVEVLHFIENAFKLISEETDRAIYEMPNYKKALKRLAQREFYFV